jgi:hypothetical protein
MAKSHARAARKIARKTGGRYEAAKSPDVRGGNARVEVKSTASEITKALRQLGPAKGRAYIALPKSEHPAAFKRMRGLKTGLMDHNGKIAKRSRRLAK